MSSIFDTVDHYASRRKNKIIEQAPSNSIFGISDLSNIKKTNIENNLQPPVQTISPLTCSQKISTSWVICELCLFIPFISWIYQSLYCINCKIEDIKMLPYDCSKFYLGLFITLPAASVYIFCSTLYFFHLSKLAVISCGISVFFFVFTVEHSCMYHPYLSDTTVFYLFSVGIAFGIVSQYIFFSNLQNIEVNRLFFLSLLGMSCFCLVITVIISTIFMFMPSVKSYHFILYTRSIPLTFTFFLYTVSTFYTLYPVEIVVSNLITNTM